MSGNANLMRFRRVVAAVALCAAVCAFAPAPTAVAQVIPRRVYLPPYPQFSAGVVGGVNFNVHTADFQSNQVYICEQFQNGSGAGIFVAGEGVYNLDRTYSVIFRAGLSNMYGAFNSTRGQIAVSDSFGTYLSEYTWKPSLSYLALQPLFGFTPVTTPLRFSIGPTLNILVGENYTEENDIVTANGPRFTFENGSNTRIVASGSVANVHAVVFGIQTGLAYEFRVRDTYVIAPEVTAHYLLASPSGDFRWNVFTLHVGISVRRILAMTR